MTPEEIAQRISQLEAEIATVEAMPDVVPTPEPELSWWERGKQLAAQPPSSIGTMTPSEYAQTWTPRGAVESLRFIPEEGASITGSVVGGTAGTVLGGPLGGILGGALGSYADVPIQMGIDYLTGATPTQSRLAQATTEAGIGAGIETGVRGLGLLGRVAALGGRATTRAVGRFLGPSTKEAAQQLVGSELAKAITREELVKAAAEKEALGSIGEALTTADVTGSKQLARMQTLLSDQPLGQANITFAETTAKQLDDLDQAALSMSALKDPNPKRAGEAARKLLEQARDAQNQSAGALFTDDLREIVAPATGISKAADDVVESIYKGSDVLGPSGTIENLLTKIRQLEGESKGAATTVGTLQDLRSQALEISRASTRGSRDELIADKISDMLSKRIDNVEGAGALREAQKAWREYKQRWFRQSDGQLSPLAKLLRKQNPEDIITSVSKKSAVTDEYAKVLGNLEPNKLATEMADFVQQQTVDKKLKWLRSKRAIFVDSPLAPVLQQWEDTLTKIQTTKQVGNVPGLSAQNIDTQAISLIRALGGVGREALASGAEASGLSALRNMGRSGVTTALGGYLGGIVGAVASPALTGMTRRSTGRTAGALAQALADPTTALKYIDDAAKFGADEAARIAIKDQQINQVMSLVESLAPQTAAGTRGAGLFTPQLTYPELTPEQIATPPAPDNLPDNEAEIEKAIASIKNRIASPVSKPTPQPESVKVGKQNVSIPTGEEYSEPRLVKAVIGAESAFNPKAVSSKGAGGLMQLMPGTAKLLKVADRFDPEQNVEGGSRYLQQQIKRFGDEKLGLAAYNWGPKNIAKAEAKLKAEGEPVTWENVKSIVHVPAETRQYVDRVMLLRKYDDFDLAKIAAHPRVGEAKLDKILAKYKTGKKFTVGDILDELGLDAKDIRVKRNNILQSASNLTEA